MAKVGFVGLGHMGLPMAINLIKAGHLVIGFDIQPSALNSFAEAGGHVAGQLQEVAQDQDVVITMLQKGDQVLQVYLGDEGLLQAAKRDALFIDCSTSGVESARELHQLAKAKNLRSLDAPVSGGVLGASARTLTIMVGGEDKAFAIGLPVLSSMGHKIIHTGGAGSGQAAKICNNLILGISMVAVSEAFTLASKLDLSAEKLYEVVSTSSGQTWAMTHCLPVPGVLDNVSANYDYQPGFAAAMMLKDLLLSQEAAKTSHVQTPLGAKTAALYQELIDQGLGDLDFSAIIKLISKPEEA